MEKKLCTSTGTHCEFANKIGCCTEPQMSMQSECTKSEILVRDIAQTSVDVFEDFLANHDIDIPNKEKENSDTLAIIYGTHYDALVDEIKWYLNEHYIITKKE